MHIEIEKDALLKALELISRVSTKHQTLPVLGCALFEVGSGLTLRATNLEVGVEVTLDVVVKEEGTIAVPTGPLLQTVQLLSQKNIVLKTKDDTLIVEAANTKTQVKTLPYDEFPTIPKFEGKAQTIQNSLFVLGVKTSAFAASQSSIKPELGSIYLCQKKEHTLTFVATDSFRLVEKTTPQKGLIFEDGVLLPSRNALELARVCELIGSDPKLHVSENQLALSFSEGVYITSRLTEGSFPDYNQIIPKEFVSHVTVLKDDFVHALKKTNIFVNKFMQVSAGIDKKKSEITLSADSGEVGTTREAISATVQGEDLSLSFNQRYLAEPLAYFMDDSITLRFAGVGRPMVIEGVNDASLRYLVMPMNK